MDIRTNVIKLHQQFGHEKMIPINHFAVCQGKKQSVNIGITFFIYHMLVSTLV